MGQKKRVRRRKNEQQKSRTSEDFHMPAVKFAENRPETQERSGPTPVSTSPFALRRKPSNQITGWDVPRGMDPDSLELECDADDE